MLATLAEPSTTHAVTTLTLAGPVGLGEAAAVQEQAMAALKLDRDVSVDLGAAEYPHPAVLQILIALERAVLRAGHAFSIPALSPDVRRALAQAGLERWSKEP